jgi:hypothetical protein
MRRAVGRAGGSRLCAVAAVVIAIGCGARTAIESDGGLEETETEEEVTTSSSAAGDPGPSQDICIAAIQAASKADPHDQFGTIDACCEAGCRPLWAGDIIDCLSPGLDCVAHPEVCTPAQYCYRTTTQDLCGVFAEHIPVSRCHDR